MEKIAKKGLDFDIRGAEKLGVKLLGNGLLINAGNVPENILDQITRMIDLGFPEKICGRMSTKEFVEMIRVQCEYESDPHHDLMILVIPEMLIPKESQIELCRFAIGEGLKVEGFRNTLHDVTRVADFSPMNPYLIKIEGLAIGDDLVGKTLNKENYSKLSQLLRKKKLRFLSIEEGVAVKREGRERGPILLEAFYSHSDSTLTLNNATRRQRGWETIAPGKIGIAVIQGTMLDFVAVEYEKNGFQIPKSIVATDYYM